MAYRLKTKVDIIQYAYELNFNDHNTLYSSDITGTDIVVDSPLYLDGEDEIADLELLASFAGLKPNEYTIVKDL